MSRRFATLVAAALIVAAVLPSGAGAASPRGALSKEDREQLAKAAANGDTTITVLIAAQKGANKTVAAGISALGRTVRDRKSVV